MSKQNISALEENSRRYFEEHFDKQKLMDEMDCYLDL